MSASVQEMIHSLEEGKGKKILVWILAVIAAGGLMLVFNTVFYRNMNTAEGMELSQLARNIAEGKGYTTLTWRPFAIHLVEAHQGDVKLLRDAQPDLQNPPLYPYLLAGWLKVLPFSYAIGGSKNTTYRPDLWVALFNQAWLLLSAYLLYRLASRVMDFTAGWMSAVLLAGTYYLWQFTFAGHPTTMLLALFILLCDAMVRADAAATGETPLPGKALQWAIVAGILVGLGALTRYSFAWMIFPVLAYFFLFLAPRQIVPGAAALIAFLVVFSPWVGRNIQVCGKPFGTAGYAIYQGTDSFPKDSLERSLYPKLDGFDHHEVRRKIVHNTRRILGTDLPRLGGNWICFMGILGVLMPFRNPSLNRLRWFALLSLGLFVVVQSAIETNLSQENKESNSENLLVLVAPVCLLFGLAFCLSLIAQLKLDAPALRNLVHGTLILAALLPLVSAFIPPRPLVSAYVYPPYYPPFFQTIGQLNRDGTASLMEKEVMMTDIPSALAWYSRTPSVLLTLNYKSDVTDKMKDDFFDFYDLRKTVRALYITQRSLNEMTVKSVASTSQEIRWTWERFVGFLIEKDGKELPPDCPMKNWARNYWPEQFYTQQAGVVGR